MKIVRFRKRTFLILSFLLFWAFLAACHVFYYSVWEKEKYRAESRKLGWKTYCVPPMRGAVRDKNNVPVLVTRLRYDLVLTRVHPSLEARKRRRARLKERYPSFLFQLPPEAVKNVPGINPEGLYCGMILKKDLSADEVVYYAGREKKERDFTVKAVFSRETAVSGLPAKFLESLGKTAVDGNGLLRGESGLEKEYDALLCGTPGKVNVMLDKYGFWVTETIGGTQAVNGKDLRLPLSVEEIRQGKTLPATMPGGGENDGKR